MEDLKQQILNKTEKPILDSKKMIVGLFGGVAVLLVWLGTIIVMFLKTEAAAQFVSLATIVISFVGAIVTTLLTGIAAMDWKSMSTVATVDTNDKEEKHIESVRTENQNINIKEEKMLKLERVDPKDLDDLDGLQYGQDNLEDAALNENSSKDMFGHREVE